MGVAVGVCVDVGLSVGVAVGVCVDVGLSVGVQVGVGVFVGINPAPCSSAPTSQAPLRVAMSTSLLKARSASPERSTPASSAAVSLESKWKSSDPALINVTVAELIGLEPGESARLDKLFVEAAVKLPEYPIVLP